MSVISAAKRILFNPVSHPSCLIKVESAQVKGRLGFGWAGEFKPYDVTGGAEYKETGNQGFGPYGGSGGFGPYGGSGGFSPYTRHVGLGYHPDLPDVRDVSVIRLSEEQRSKIADVMDIIKKENARRVLGASQSEQAVAKKAAEFKSFLLHEESMSMPDCYDLRATGYFSPVEDQGQIGSCTAHAVVGLVEYLMRAGGDPGTDLSRLFLYKVSRNLLGWSGDNGAYLRTAIKGMALFGIPPESDWPYFEERYNEEPQAYHYAFAQNFKATRYARLDGANGQDTLDSVKRCLCDGFPTVFGFPVYRSIGQVGRTVGKVQNFIIPFPSQKDSLVGGHAVLAIGFDDRIEYEVDGATQKGALIIRNSWGASWGSEGYAYLPYEYLRAQLALDFWTIFNKDWFHLEVFD